MRTLAASLLFAPLLAGLVACSASSSGASGGSDAGGHDAGGRDAARDASPTDAARDSTVADADAATGPNAYGGDGPASVTTQSLTVTPPGGSTFAVTAYVPGTPGPHPVVFFESGFFQQAAGYGPYGQRLATWGIVAILRSDPGLGATTPALADDVAYVVSTWLPAQQADTTSPLAGLLDVARVGLAGHSRGGQITLLAAELGAHGKVKGVFGLDPVDTAVDGSVVARTAIATLGIPVAFVGETTDGTGDAMPCAPAADNYEVLYGAAAPPAVAITAVNADHTMFEDPANCFACGACTPGTADAGSVLELSVRYLTAFFARELLGDAHVGARFEGAGAASDLDAGVVTIQAK
jgi:dienelactone hydrolase